jgi:uncharacterized protein
MGKRSHVAASWSEKLGRFFGRGVCPHELSFILTLALRRLILKPETLVLQMALEPHERVLELGPGPGFFSAAVAGALPEGHLILADIQRPMLAKATKRLQTAGLAGRASAVHADALGLPLADDSIDIAFAVAVLGETPDPTAALAELCRIVRPGGRIVVTEQPGDPDALTTEQLVAMGSELHLTLAEQYGRGRNFTVVFRPA